MLGHRSGQPHQLGLLHRQGVAVTRPPQRDGPLQGTEQLGFGDTTTGVGSAGHTTTIDRTNVRVDGE